MYMFFSSHHFYLYPVSTNKHVEKHIKKNTQEKHYFNNNILFVCLGECICEDNTAGDNCERCNVGYYGYALAGTPNDCQQCPCPNGGECVELLNKDVVCINCREGFTGKGEKNKT